MAISDYIKKFFAPKQNVRVRDVVREIPGTIGRAAEKVLPGVKAARESIQQKTLTPYKAFLASALAKNTPKITSVDSQGKIAVNKQGFDMAINLAGSIGPGNLNKAKDAITPIASEIERGFISSVKEVLPKMGRVAGQYIPRSTDELAIKAKNLIKENADVAEKIAMTRSDESAVAIASELIKKYGDDAINATDQVQAAAFYDKAAKLANTLAPKLTEQGRAIQAASILGRLTPEGQVRFAASQIMKYNETALKKIPELTGEQAGFIVREMGDIAKMVDGTEKAMKFKQLQDYISELVPTPLMKKITSVWKAGLLTGLKTSGVNIFSNLSHAGLEIAKDVPAAVVDNVASLFTGQRAKTFTLKGTGGGLKEGFDKGIQYMKTGFDERNVAEKFDYNKVNFGKGNVGQAFRKYTDFVFRAMGTADQPFYYGALSRSLTDQAKAQAKNKGLVGEELKKFVDELIDSPTEEMMRYAVSDASTAVFQNKTKLGEIARGIQKLGGGLGEVFIPFARTPSAVAMQVINYTPVGLAKTIIENIGKGKFDQRMFSQGVGRGLTGTAILAIGAEMGRRGMVSLDYPKGDEREQELQKAEGIKNNAIKIGGKWRSPNVLGPAGNVLLIGAHLQNAYEKSGSATEAFVKAVTGGIKSFTEQTFLTGLEDAVNAITDPERYAKSYLPNLVASLVPTIISDVARASDPKERRVGGKNILEMTGQSLQARIPGARSKLEPQVDIIGRERDSVGNPLEIILDPTRPSNDISTPVTEELRRLMNEKYRVSPTMLGDKQGYKALTKEQNTQLWKLSGDIVNDKLDSLFAREEYQNLSDEDKAKTVEKIIDQAKINARAGVAIEITQGMSGGELKKKLAELKKDGLLTKAVFAKYQELR